MKSFDLLFDANGNAVIYNITGVDGLDCLELTKPYIEEMEDKANPAVTEIDPEHTLSDNNTFEDAN